MKTEHTPGPWTISKERQIQSPPFFHINMGKEKFKQPISQVKVSKKPKPMQN